ncbi:MAG: glycine cleavage system protein GcvH [Deltaproteobacteria bacterium]|nr:glycine cleavage system protein GcvH [Deltaproteobacteria bacterium]MBW2447373.1 glycine cleavage system protein GcvH [Deltaproteobacteria bacterium]
MAEYNLPDSVRYSREDEWTRVEGDHVVIGITDYAQQQLGDIVFVELPEPGTQVAAGDPFGVIESVKTVSDLFAPITGEIVTINTDLAETPEAVNDDCYGDGWMLTIQPASSDELQGLLSAQDYAQHIKDREE